MKITVTKAELLEILSKHFGVEIMECTIAKPSTLAKDITDFLKDTVMKSVGTLRMATLPVNAQTWTGENKIPAIKALREWYHGKYKDNLGLAEAKWAIENWDQWIGFVIKRGRAPKIINVFSNPTLK